MQLKRQHSFESVDVSSPPPATRKTSFHGSSSPKSIGTPVQKSTSNSPPTLLTNATYDPSGGGKVSDSFMGSPLKKRRSSLQGLDHELERVKGKEVFGLGVGIGDSATNGLFGGDLKRAGWNTDGDRSGNVISEAKEELSSMEEEL